MRMVIFAACLAAIAYGGYRVAARYRAATGSVYARALAAAQGSATVLWSYVVALGGVALQAAGQGAEIFELPEVREAIAAWLAPEWAGAVLLLIGVITVLARLRTLVEKDAADA
jgi:hypothetical protein